MSGSRRWILGVALLASAPGVAGARSLAFVPESWVYRLQPREVDDRVRWFRDPCASYLEEVDATPTDIAVIDAGCTEGPRDFGREEIERLKSQPDHRRRLVLAYLSIGEAEDYRFYWRKSYRPGRKILGFRTKGNPGWLAEENPDWEGNYRVRYWDPAWQAILLDGPRIGPGGAPVKSALARILDAGFDGVYLDIVDGYEAFEKERPTARRDMVELVRRIREYGDARFRIPEGGAHPHPGFQVVAQNATALLVDPEVGDAYRKLLNGAGVEELYFRAHDERQDPEETREVEGHLARLKEVGGYVLTVDYARTPATIGEAYRRSRAQGFVPYATHVDLDRISVPPRPLDWREHPMRILPVDVEPATKPSVDPAPSKSATPAVAQAVLKGTTPGVITSSVALAAVLGVTMGPLAGVVGAAAGAGLAKGIRAVWDRVRGKKEEDEAGVGRDAPDPLVPPGLDVAASRDGEGGAAAGYKRAAEDLRRALTTGTFEERSAAWVRYRAAWGAYVTEVQAGN